MAKTPARKLAILEAKKRYKGTCKGKAAEIRYRHSQACREVHGRYYRTHVKNHIARVMAGVAVRRGDLVGPDSCEQCGTVASLEKHHPNYDKPLEVVWVCLKCHKEIHRLQRILA